jgi:hypothetical protein
VLNSISRAVTIIALCFSLGLHWLALQSVAWTTMLAANARHAPLSEAVAKTFDGEHPCSLCHAVAAGKKSEKKSELPPTIAKMDLICTTRTLTWLPPYVLHRYAPTRFVIPERFLAPPVPPPRSLPG